MLPSRRKRMLHNETALLWYVSRYEGARWSDIIFSDEIMCLYCGVPVHYIAPVMILLIQCVFTLLSSTYKNDTVTISIYKYGTYVPTIIYNLGFINSKSDGIAGGFLKLRTPARNFPLDFVHSQNILRF